MALIAEPIFFESLRAASGARRKLIQINNTGDERVRATISEVEKPEWIELEGIHPEVELEVRARGKMPVVANINTNHRFFPKGECRNQKMKVILDNDQVIEFALTVPKIMPRYDDFRGVFALDFGTTNSCYAYRGGAAERGQGGGNGARASSEIPTLVYFHDVSDGQNPKYSVGTEAKFDIRDNSGRTYSYMISVKRLLGQDRTIFIMDRLAAVSRSHQREYSTEQIASFILRTIIERAQEDIGGRVTNVVATYPPMFSQDRKEAIRSAFTMAFRDLEVDFSDDELTKTIMMELDEANAAAFNYVYHTMLDEFRKFRVDKRECQLLSFDFGGGTTDISLVDVNIEQDAESGRIKIATQLKGLSGDANYGGDNVTLETLKMLKRRLALRVAELHQDEAGSAGAPQDGEGDEKEESGGDIWAQLISGGGGGSASAGEESDDSGWAGIGTASEGAGGWDELLGGQSEEEQDEEVATAEEEEVIDPDLEGVERLVSDDEYRDALRTINDAQSIVEMTIKNRMSMFEATLQAEKSSGEYVSKQQTQDRADAIDAAIETVIPTRFGTYTNEQPHMEDLARKLFHELWHEADSLKIQLSTSEDKPIQFRGLLKKVAKHADVDPAEFNTVQFSLSDLDAQIEDAVASNLQKAKALFDGAQARSFGAEGSLMLGGAETGGGPQLRVLLFGNSSRLPIVRRKALEVFGIAEQNLIMDSDMLKSAVARGACEDRRLRRDFGTKGGVIEYQAENFLAKLPFAMGLKNEDLEFMGFEGGYCTIFPRGTRAGKVKVLTQDRFYLVQPEMEELEIYADYMDGSEAQYVGWFDFKNPTPDSEIPERVAEKDVEVQKVKPDEVEKDLDESESGDLDLGGGGGLDLGGGGGGGLDLGAPAAAPAAAEQVETKPAETTKPEGFYIEVELLPTRQLLATRGDDGRQFLLRRDHSYIPPDRDPFSGVH